MVNLEGRPAYLKCGPTDMRKAINGLTELVQSSFELSPFDDALFVFCNRSRDRVKILVWDADGFWLLFKRLEKGHFRWPQPGSSQVMALSNEELAVLLDGVKVELKLKRAEGGARSCLSEVLRQLRAPVKLRSEKSRKSSWNKLEKLEFSGFFCYT